MGALAEYTEKRFGVKTRQVDNPLASVAGVGVTKILNFNPDRLMVVFVNLDLVAMYVGWFGDVSTSKGVRVGGSGGHFVMVADDDAELVGMELFVYSAAGGNIFVCEVEAE